MSTGKFDKRFTEFNSLNAYLTAQGATYSRALPLYAIGSDGNDANIIGHWGYNASGAIVPMGTVYFNKVTASKYGTVASAIGTTATLTAGHNITKVGILRFWNVTDGILIADVVSANWSISGDNLTVSASVATDIASAISGSKVVMVWCEGVSEFSIGGSSRDIQPKDGTHAFFVGTGLSKLGRVVYAPFGFYRLAKLRANLASYTELSNTGKRAMVGWNVNNTNWSGLGWSRTAAPTIVSSRESGNKTLSTTIVTSVGTWSYIGCFHLVGPTSNSSRWYQFADNIALASAVHFVDINNNDYAEALLYTVFDDGAVISSLEVE